MILRQADGGAGNVGLGDPLLNDARDIPGREPAAVVWRHQPAVRHRRGWQMDVAAQIHGQIGVANRVAGAERATELG